VAPGGGDFSTDLIAPEKIHGWRLLMDFSRPGFRMMEGMYLNQGSFLIKVFAFFFGRLFPKVPRNTFPFLDL
jgi:hypothetical protein